MLKHLPAWRVDGTRITARIERTLMALFQHQGHGFVDFARSDGVVPALDL